MDEPIAGLQQIALAIHDRVTDALERASGVPLRRRIESAAELVRHGEPGIGLENLCSNLHEFGEPLGGGAYEGLVVPGEVLNLPADTWTALGNRKARDPNQPSALATTQNDGATERPSTRQKSALRLA